MAKTWRQVAPRNLRRIEPTRACGSCAVLHMDCESYICRRPEGPEFSLYDEEGLERWFYVCDNWIEEG